MRYSIRWASTTTHTATIEISLAELADWASTASQVRAIAALSPIAPQASELEASLALNQHLRARVLQLYTDAHHLVDAVEVHGPQILNVEEDPAPENTSTKRRKVIGEATHEDN